MKASLVEDRAEASATKFRSKIRGSFQNLYWKLPYPQFTHWLRLPLTALLMLAILSIMVFSHVSYVVIILSPPYD
jgi:hypothetical protein